MDYSKIFSPLATPQTQPLIGKSMTKNHAGGYGFQVDKWKRLDRFLTLGSEGGTYYVGEAKLTEENGRTIMECLAEHGIKTVSRILDISLCGRAKKQDATLFALALACAHGDAHTKIAARIAVEKVCRTGTMLFQFCEAYKGVGGKTSRGHKRSVSNFYLKKSPEKLALQLIKYRQRNGWTHRDVLRQCHAPGKPDGPLHNLLRFAAGKPIDGEQHALIDAFGRLQAEKNPQRAAALIESAKLPWEAVPTELLNSKEVWEALLLSMPYTATLRNLGKLTSLGFFGSDLGADTKFVTERLLDKEQIKKGRVHPFSILLAYSTYAAGRGVKGSLSWSPAPKILGALDEAFTYAFKGLAPTGKKILVGQDVSGSMSASVQGSHLSAAQAGLVMAAIHKRVEKDCELMAFDTDSKRLSIPDRASLGELLEAARGFQGGGTDCSVPFQWAIRHKLKLDAIIVYTDSETWAGNAHVTQVFDQYRKKFAPNCKAIDVAMTATSNSISDPGDESMLAIAGMDASVPEVIREFLVGVEQ